MSYPLCYHNPMMKMKEQLFKVTLARWEDGTATTTHVLAMDLEHAKRVAWKKWKSVTVEPAPFHTNAKEEFGEFVSQDGGCPTPYAILDAVKRL